MLSVEEDEEDEEDENPLFTLLPMKLEALPFIADCGAIHGLRGNSRSSKQGIVI